MSLQSNRVQTCAYANGDFMRLDARLTAILCASVLFAAAPLTAPAEPLQQLPSPVPVPAFKLPGLNGSSGSDADLRNKVTVIRFWASW
jgi:hypothetical protein